LCEKLSIAKQYLDCMNNAMHSTKMWIYLNCAIWKLIQDFTLKSMLDKGKRG